MAYERGLVVPGQIDVTSVGDAEPGR